MRPEDMMQRSNAPAERAIIEIWVRLLGSLRLDASCLDDRPPLFDFGFLQGGERLRCLLLATWNFHALFSNPLPHSRVGLAVIGIGLSPGGQEPGVACGAHA
jgi:hypothetical protein